MNLYDLTDRELADIHADKLAKAQAARADNDLDLAQRYLAILRPINVEMHGRIQERNRVRGLYA
jgi:hypothetical protein